MTPKSIPLFPDFRPLRSDDRIAVEAFTRNLPPYSDFNFTSLWCWDVFGTGRLAQLNGNLIFRFADYLTGEAFYSFCGDSAVTETAAILIECARREGLSPMLRLLPAESVAALYSRGFAIQEDPDNFDYILCLEKMSTFRGKRLRGKRNFVNRFCRQKHMTVCEMDLTADTVRQIELLLLRWADNKSQSVEQTRNEFAAIRRFLACRDRAKFLTIGIFKDDRLIGFSISERLAQGYAMLHFEKADTELVGIYPYIMQETARRLAKCGCCYLNYQQDLGLVGLRQCKRSYQPCSLLKKFQVTADVLSLRSPEVIAVG